MKSDTIRRAVGFFSLAALLSACAVTSYRTAVPVGCDDSGLNCPVAAPVDCIALMERRDAAQLAGKILAGVGGVAALAAAPESIPEAGRWSIGASAATVTPVLVVFESAAPSEADGGVL